MVKKQKSELPGLSSAHTIADRRWVLLGDDVRVARDMATRGLQIMCRERGDHVELVPLDLGLPPEALTNYYFYVWHSDIFPPNPALEEDYQLRLKLWQQGQEKAAAPPAPRTPGPKPRRDWPIHVAHYVGYVKGSGKEIPTAAKIAEWCETKVNYSPDPGDINKLLKKLHD